MTLPASGARHICSHRNSIERNTRPTSSQAIPRTIFVAAVVCLLAFAIAAPAAAQVVPPPVFPAVDSNGVDVARGSLVLSQTDVVIGQPGAGGLSYARYYQSSDGSWTSNHNGYILESGTTCSVVIGQMTETFTSQQSGCLGPFTSDQQLGSTLTLAGQQYTYTAADGSTATFGGSDTQMNGNPYLQGLLTSTTSVQGETTSYAYSVYVQNANCYPPPGCIIIYYTLTTVTNNFGYRLAFEFSPTQYKVTGINAAVENCGGSNCSQPWPSVTLTYQPNSTLLATATNSVGATTSYTYTPSYPFRITEVQFADYPDHDINIAYTSNRVSSVDRGFATWNYAYGDYGSIRLTTVTNPDATTRVYASVIATGRIGGVTNELGQTVGYSYDSANRQTRVTQPEGNYAEYAYDSRGNITRIWLGTKVSTTTPDIFSATYPSSCTNPRTCNKPTETFDARGYRTDTTYDETHGGVLTITAPAPMGGAPIGSGARPQTRFEYAQFQARYMDTAGGWINGTPVWLPTKRAACATATSCINTANEAKTTFAYPSPSTANNLQPTSATTAAGDGTLSATTAMTYTNLGDVREVDGPLASDTTRYYYDAGRRLVGVVGPDPDGGGPLLYRAARTTYSAIGQPTLVERGTVTSQTDTALSSFAALEQQETGYDSFARPIVSRLWNGGSIVALTQASYDSNGRPQCSVVRMNSATFASPPSSACTLGSAGAYGPDRITRNTYDYAGRISVVQSAYGTALAQSTAAYTYTPNGQVETLTDARNFRTTYEYDSLDRLFKRRYPNPNTPNQSSASDYEELAYDDLGRAWRERRRSGEWFELGYDNVGRVTLRNAPDPQLDISYVHDLLNRIRSESQTGNTVTTTYDDVLSRVTRVTSSVTTGEVRYDTDPAGRRERMTYPDGFYVTYAYNTAGDLTGISDNTATSLATYAYDNLGRRTSLTRLNGVATNYTFDGASRLSTLQQNPVGTTHDTTFGFNYNPAGQITTRTRTNAIFDWVVPGNSSESYAPNGLNQYTGAYGIAPTYDTRGNLTWDGTRTYVYDFDNRITTGGGVTLNYDPAGRLHTVAGSGNTTAFLYDGADVIAEYTNGVETRRYVHGPGADEPLVSYQGTNLSDRRWVIADERGSVIGTTDASGAVTAVNKYDVYGIPAAANDDGRFKYTGQMWIPELGLYHYKARAYHPRLGRFMQTDPIGYAGGMNLYSYGGNDPVNRTDPSGLCWQLVPDLAWKGVTVQDPETGDEFTKWESYTREVWECIWTLGWTAWEVSQSDAFGIAVDTLSSSNAPQPTGPQCKNPDGSIANDPRGTFLDPNVGYLSLYLEGYLVIGGGLAGGVYRDQDAGNWGFFLSLELGGGWGGSGGLSFGAVSQLGAFNGTAHVLGGGEGPVSVNYISKNGNPFAPRGAAIGPSVNLMPALPPLTLSSFHSSPSFTLLSGVPPCQ